MYRSYIPRKFVQDMNLHKIWRKNFHKFLVQVSWACITFNHDLKLAPQTCLLIAVQLFVSDRPFTEDSLLLRRRGASTLPSVVAGHRRVSLFVVWRRRGFLHLGHQLRVKHRRRRPGNARRWRQRGSQRSSTGARCFGVDRKRVEVLVRHRKRDQQGTLPGDVRAIAKYDDVAEFRKARIQIGDVVELLVTSELEDNAMRATSEVAATAIILVVVLALAPVVFLLIHRMTLTIQNYALGLSKKTKELRREKKRSDTLLYQMLPKSVALQLKLSKKVRWFALIRLSVYTFIITIIIITII